MDETPRDRVLTALIERDVSLPEDGLTLEKIKKRAFAFQFESDEMLSFREEIVSIARAYGILPRSFS